MTGYYLLILQGGLLTVGVSLGALVVAILLGFVGAAAKLSGVRPLLAAANVYTTVIRGIPELVLMLLVFYGGTVVGNLILESLGSSATVDLEPMTAGIATIGFIYGAYLTEVFRGAILAIPRGQIEAALAYGMRPLQIFLRITFPLMVRYALPGFTNTWLVLIKATALVSLIGVHEMTYIARQASAATREPFVFLLFTAALFLIYTSVSLIVLRWLHTRYSMGVKRSAMA